MRAAWPRIALVLCLAVLGACVSKITASTVREKASHDLPCDAEQIEVEEADAGPKTYVATGCGQKATYRCNGWDSYDQQPICQHLP